MSRLAGWYYLHANGELVFKKQTPGIAGHIRESSFAHGLWPFDPRDLEGSYSILVEALAAGAKLERILELAELWRFDRHGQQAFARRVGCALSIKRGRWCVTSRALGGKSPAGYGVTPLEAMADLATALGYQPGLEPGKRFYQLVTGQGGKDDGRPKQDRVD